MIDPEKTPDKGTIPIVPRDAVIPDEAKKDGVDSAADLKKHSFTPASGMNVEFWHHGEKAAESEVPTPKPRGTHSKKADQFSMMLIGLSVVVLIIIAAGFIYLSYKQQEGLDADKGDHPAAFDFYQGKQAFEERIAAEKAAKLGRPKTGESSTGSAIDELEVTLEDQVLSMNQKIEKMRARKMQVELPRATPFQAEPPKPVAPVKMENFKAPEDLGTPDPKSQ